MIGNVADRLGPSSKVSATCPWMAAPWVMPPPNQCTLGVSAPTYAPNPITARSTTVAVIRRRARAGAPFAAAPRSRLTPAPKKAARIAALGEVGALGEEPGCDQCGEPADDPRRDRPAREARDRRPGAQRNDDEREVAEPAGLGPGRDGRHEAQPQHRARDRGEGHGHPAEVEDGPRVARA